jgi:hypothetical protein
MWGLGTGCPGGGNGQDDGMTGWGGQNRDAVGFLGAWTPGRPRSLANPSGLHGLSAVGVGVADPSACGWMSKNDSRRDAETQRKRSWAKRGRTETGIASKNTKRRKKAGNARNEPTPSRFLFLSSFRFLRRSLSASPRLRVNLSPFNRLVAAEGHRLMCARDGGEKCEDRPSVKAGVPCRPGPVAGFRTWQADPGSVDGDGCVG